MKKWNELTLTQKRHRLYHLTNCRLMYFWGVCGKERQRFYNNIQYSKENIDEIKELMVNEYLNGLNNIYVFDKKEKINSLKEMTE